MTSPTLHRPRAATATTTTANPEPPTSPIQAMVRAQTRRYQRHVLAWYALGRGQEARAAWAAVCDLRRLLADGQLLETHLRRS